MLEILKKYLTQLEPDSNKNLNNNDELAYLAMTSKFEHPFRDKLALNLFKQFKNNGKYVCREWTPTKKQQTKDEKDEKTRRVDIAIIEGENEPQCLIEVKATNTQNGYGGFKDKKKLNHVEQHIQELIQQLLTWRKKSKFNDTKIYGILIATHPELPKIDPIYECMVRSCYKDPKDKDINEIKTAYENTVKNEKEIKNGTISLVHDKQLNIGKFYNTPISLIVHILECN